MNIRLTWLPANQRYCFTCGEDIISVDGAALFNDMDEVNWTLTKLGLTLRDGVLVVA